MNHPREIAVGRASPRARGGVGPASGFTLIELLVTLLLFSILLAGTWSAVVSQKRSYVAQDALLEIQGSIQPGFGEISLDLMHAGYGRAFANFPAGCRNLGFLQATPFQVVFLYDIDNSIEDDNTSPDGPRFTFADDSGTQRLVCDGAGCTGTCSTTPNNCADSGACVHANMHAEVIRWTLDSTGNALAPIVAAGAARAPIAFTAANAQAAATNVSAADMDTASQNPSDYILFREVNDRCRADAGGDCSAFDGAGNGEDIPFAYGVRGPDAAGNWPLDAAGVPGNWMPMFVYYMDGDGNGNFNCVGGAGSDYLFGDSNLDCTLANSEVNTMMTGPASGMVVPQNDMWRVIGTRIQIRGEAKMPDPDYDQNCIAGAGCYRFRILTGGAKANNLAF